MKIENKPTLKSTGLGDKRDEYTEFAMALLVAEGDYPYVEFNKAGIRLLILSAM